MKDFLRNNKVEIVLIVICFSIGIVMMIRNLTYSPLWYDEQVEWLYSKQPFSDGQWYNSVSSTLQPPLYNFLMHFWLKVRDDIWWFRFANVLMGIVANAFLYLSVRKLYNNKIFACLTVVLLAFCYQWIYYIQECAEYCLMMTCLFGALYYFIKVINCEEWSAASNVLFIVFMTAAIYSQYGAIFVALPAFLIVFVIALQTKCVKKILFVIALYVLDMIAFGIPLYVFFFCNKFKRIAGNSDVQLAKLKLSDYFKNIGQVIGYFNNNYNKSFCSVIGIVFLLLTLIIFIWAKKEKHKKTIILISLFIICYLLHSTLVQLDYYSTSYQKGVACRYSLFYIPLLFIMLPMYFMEVASMIKSSRWQRGVYTIGLLAAISVIDFNFKDINDNWKKSYDDVVARTWVEQEGYKTKTYLFGWPGIGCREFLNSYGYDFYTYIQTVDSSINPELDFPDAFWIWRTGLTADTVIVDAIVEKLVGGEIYDCDIVVDYVCDGGNKAQLMYFYK